MEEESVLLCTVTTGVCWGLSHYSREQQHPSEGGQPQKARQFCLLLSEMKAASAGTPQAGHVQASGKCWSQPSFHPGSSESKSPSNAYPCFSCPFFWTEKCNSGQLLMLSSAIWSCWRNSWQTGLHAHAGLSFSFSWSFAPFLWLNNLPLLVRQGWAFWIVFICWRSGVKALPVNCILILSAVCIYFPPPPSTGLIYGFPFHYFLLSQWLGKLCHGFSGLHQAQDLSL